MNIAINGFGRIGRATFKILLEKKDAGEDINIVAINDLGTIESLAYLLKYDSVYGRYGKVVKHEEGKLIVDGTEYKMLAVKEPLQLPWKDLNVDIVIECTGIFTESEKARQHLTAGAKKLVLSAPAKDDGFQTLVFGSDSMTETTDLVSNASCTTNSITPVIRMLNDAFGVEKALLTTVHAYTASQSLVDGPSKKDLREGRAAAHNIIPSSTGAAKATGKAMPSMAGIFDGISLRVPVICGSISDITAVLKKNVTAEEVNAALKAASETPEMQKLVMYTEEPLVSGDIIKTSYSAIIDGEMTRVVGGNLVKVLAWYDNEWGYSNRLVEMALHICKSSAS